MPKKRTMTSRANILFLFICLSTLTMQAADLIIFSKDRPLQLEALLTSVGLHVKGLASISVLFTTSNDHFNRGYTHLREQFPSVNWTQQNRTQQRNDFSPLLKTIFNSTAAQYVMFAVDDMIVIDAVDIPLCITMMQQTGAYGCYLRLGKDTNYCYAYKSAMAIPELHDVGSGYYSWELRTASKCWGYPHTVDMTIYRRETVQEAVHLAGSSPNIFEAVWSGKGIPSQARGICYETSRVINIPLNLVQKDYKNNCSHRYSTGQLLKLFEEGWHIDVKKLYKLPHNAPHIDIDIPLTQLTH